MAEDAEEWVKTHGRVLANRVMRGKPVPPPSSSRKKIMKYVHLTKKQKLYARPRGAAPKDANGLRKVWNHIHGKWSVASE